MDQKISSSKFPFAHHQLEVYRLALRMVSMAKEVAEKIPRSFRNYADHLKRSSGNTVLLIGEGANRYATGMKRQRYEEALGEAGEVAVALEVVVTLGLIVASDIAELMDVTGRVCAMLSRLVQRHRS